MNKTEMKDTLEVLLNGFHKSGELFIFLSEFDNEEEEAKRMYVGEEVMFISREQCEKHGTDRINIFIQLKSDGWQSSEEFHKDTQENGKFYSKKLSYHS